MQITMNDMVAINQILSEHKNDKMPPRTAYKFYKILSSFENDFAFFQAHYKEIIEKYAEKDESGELKIDSSNNFTIPKENVADYAKEMGELLDTEIEVPNYTFTLDELDMLDITIQEASSLDSIIKE